MAKGAKITISEALAAMIKRDPPFHKVKWIASTSAEGTQRCNLPAAKPRY